ncbi:MAG: DUF362 domain-containing protein [Chloroflexota bacterium]
MAKSIVSITKGADAEKMVAEALALLGGVDTLIRPGSTVVVKPNAGHPYAPETGVCTSPAVVGAVIKELKKSQAKEVILAEAAAVGCDTLECFEVSGIGKAAKDAGVDKIIDIKRETDLIKFPIRDAKSALNTVLLPRFLIEAEHIVNIPIFKSHVAMVFTCSLKNIKGVVQDKVHRQMHLTNLTEAMMDLWSVVKADITVADVIRPAEGFGPHNAMPTDFGCIVAGKDPVAVDATICRMVGLDTEKVPYFTAARERGLGHYEEKFIEIRGKTIKEVFKQLWLPYIGGMNQWPEYNVCADKACSSCQGLLAFTMERLKATGEYEKHAGDTIVVGPTKELPKGVKKENLILFGDCVKKYRDQGIFVEGCPPLESMPYFSITTRQDSEKRATAPRNKESEAANTRAFLEYAKKLKEKADSEIKKKPTPKGK